MITLIGASRPNKNGYVESRVEDYTINDGWLSEQDEYHLVEDLRHNYELFREENLKMNLTKAGVVGSVILVVTSLITGLVMT